MIADVSATALYCDLLPDHAVPDRVRADLTTFTWDTPVLKLNWVVDGSVPWRANHAAEAGTVHLGADADGLVRWAADLETGTLPTSPFLVMGQMTTTDPTRSPEGTESAWAYTHLPRGVTATAAADELAQRMETVLEAHAPGFTERIIGWYVQRPSELEAADANLVGGAVNGGTAQLFQQLIFRPAPGLGRPQTPIAGLYLGSSAIHPGGGVHGVCGWLAARAALTEHGALGWLRQRSGSAVLSLIVRDTPR